MSILIIISAIIAVSKSALTCNGIEYSLATTTTTVPADVCYHPVANAGGTFSYWYQCINGKVYFNQYTNENCIGDPQSTLAETMYGAYDLQQRCDLGACQVAKVKKITASWSDCSDAATAPSNLESYTEVPFIQDKCMDISGVYSESWTCSNDGSTATHSFYNSVSDCSGTPITTTVNTNELACDNTNSGAGGISGVPVFVTCETASFAGTDATLPPAPAVTTPPIRQCTDTTLDCKAVEWNINGITTAYPLDVCFSVESTTNDQTVAVSYWYNCKNGVPYVSTYSTADCAGTASETLLVSLYPLSEYVTVCCDLTPCKYVVQKTYTSIDLDCTDADPSDLEAYTSLPIVEGYCNAITDLASYKWSCDGNEARKDYYSGNGECSGNATITLFDMEVEVNCDDTDEQIAATTSIGLECGTASFNGGNNGPSNNGGGNTPTTTTTETPCPAVGCVNSNRGNTPTTTTTETPCPAVGCVNSNRGNMKCGSWTWIFVIIGFIARLAF